MNWIVFGLISWIFLGLELGLRDVLQLGPTPIAPSFMFVLVAFIAVSARPRLGLGRDRPRPARRPYQRHALPRGRGAITIVGPHALGYLLAAQLILAARAMMIRRHPISLAILTALGAAVAHIVVVFLLSMRLVLGEPIAVEASAQIGQRLLRASTPGAWPRCSQSCSSHSRGRSGFTACRPDASAARLTRDDVRRPAIPRSRSFASTSRSIASAVATSSITTWSAPH